MGEVPKPMGPATHCDLVFVLFPDPGARERGERRDVHIIEAIPLDEFLQSSPILSRVVRVRYQRSIRIDLIFAQYLDGSAVGIHGGSFVHRLQFPIGSSFKTDDHSFETQVSPLPDDFLMLCDEIGTAVDEILLSNSPLAQQPGNPRKTSGFKEKDVVYNVYFFGLDFFQFADN
jgi:hypothetical protein